MSSNEAERPNIDVLPPGEELDRLVAEHVMNWRLFNEPWIQRGAYANPNALHERTIARGNNEWHEEHIPTFSTTGAEIHLIEKRLQDLGYQFEIGQEGEQWHCRIDMIEATGGTRELALCRCALKALRF